jgi:ubiquinone/menaquinone biosynthesis C-methylase UbiE
MRPNLPTWLLWKASQLLYSHLAWMYDVAAWLVSNGQWRVWQRVGLAEAPGGLVLEMAFGPGHLLEERAANGFPMIGIDRSPQMVRKASRRLRKAGYPLRITRADVRRMPFATARFEAIVSTFPAEFIVDPAVHAEARRVLRDGAPWIIIPSARVIGRRGLDLLLGILGRQLRLQDDLLPAFGERLRLAGFLVDSGWVTLPRSEVMQIVARRAPSTRREGRR